MSLRHSISFAGLLLSLGCAGAPAGEPTFQVLYRFGSTPADGTLANSAPVADSNGVLYGATLDGGTSTGNSRRTCDFGCGTAYSLTPPAAPGGAWTESILWSFGDGNDGQSPEGGLVLGSGGVLYGATEFGGKNHRGTIFSLTPPSSPGGAWTENIVWSFGKHGYFPGSGLAIGADGVLYGVTPIVSTIFSLTPPASAGEPWTYRVLHRLRGIVKEGDGPNTRLMIGPAGVLYGTTSFGGSGANAGVVFSLTPPSSPGAKWTYQVLYRFNGAAGHGGGGMAPESSLILRNEMLFGSTSRGSEGGTVFSLAPRKAGHLWKGQVLHSFKTQHNGQEPSGNLVVEGMARVIYGTTYTGGRANPLCIAGECGTVFELREPAAGSSDWRLRVLHRFSGPDGGNPAGGVTLGIDGVLYGVTDGEGGHDAGTVFAVTP